MRAFAIASACGLLVGLLFERGAGGAGRRPASR